MRTLTKILPVALLLATNCAAQTSNEEYPLFRIVENNKVGYINQYGKVIIPPTFASGNEFSEQLAPVRLNGTYGYINTKGDYVIQPVYDYATTFEDGVGIVFKDGKRLYVNKKGEETPFSIRDEKIVRDGYKLSLGGTIVSSKGLYGLTNREGQLILDTINKQINAFVNGYAVIQGPKHTPYSDTPSYQIGVIDTNGKFTIPFGLCEEIYDYNEGYYRVTFVEDIDTSNNTSTEGFIDMKGNIISKIDYGNSSYIYGDVHCGLATIYLRKYWLPDEKDGRTNYDKTYIGYINVQGDLVVNDTNYVHGYNFSENRAFVRVDGYNYQIINTKGELVSKDTFSNVIGERFKEGKAVVELNDYWTVIDTNGRALFNSKYEDIDNIGLVGNYLFFRDYIEREGEEEDEEAYGIARIDGVEILPATMNNFDRGGFKNGLLKCIINDKLAFVNEQGEIVWRQNADTSTGLNALNIDYMNRGYFYASSKPHKEDIGGQHYGSSNAPMPISKKMNLPKNKLSITVMPNLPDTFYQFKGITAYVANTTRKDILFGAQDFRLYMTVQALDTKGEWKDIEYTPNSWCGNSYHTLTLEPKQYWKFVVPEYAGSYKTKLRISLTYRSGKQDKDGRYISITEYSNEYEGHINPAQFWRKQGYSPTSIMDPYNE